MVRIRLTPEDRKHYEQTAEGRAYLEYNDKVGGEPIGLMVPTGYPQGVHEMGGVIAVYNECIRRGMTWKELLNYQEPPDDALI
ncbi:hypothetical protein ACFP7A_12555 [Sporolactobacillus kofuensis]|uniref:Uncharacterized protein n=1 Tax=Sporolactobacillus kofuensis TaxID=269672 RepID=A0ABW1WK36_9BACL|nr:hypothetical protein [Sporolactobacillus kofuensis]MCO7176881.1 hypothetical protein [Sporolactobacillus kofuensis]